MESVDIEESDLREHSEIEPINGTDAQSSPGVGRILAAMKEKAERNRGSQEIHPTWDPKGSGKGSSVFGVLKEKRKVNVNGDDRLLLVIDNQTPTKAKDRDGIYDQYSGLISVWCGAVLARFWETAEIGKLAYIEYLGKVRARSGRTFNDFAYSQAGRDEIGNMR
jgi:hypothetical protein